MRYQLLFIRPADKGTPPITTSVYSSISETEYSDSHIINSLFLFKDKGIPDIIIWYWVIKDGFTVQYISIYDFVLLSWEKVNLFPYHTNELSFIIGELGSKFKGSIVSLRIILRAYIWESVPVENSEGIDSIYWDRVKGIPLIVIFWEEGINNDSLGLSPSNAITGVKAKSFLTVSANSILLFPKGLIYDGIF